MKKLFAALCILFLLPIVACGEKNDNFWGELDNMEIQYDTRSSEMIAKMWWDRGNDTSDRHVALIYDMSWASVADGIQSGENSVDKLSLSQFSFGDRSLPTLIENFLIDYRYRQVLFLLRTGEESEEEYRNAVQAVMQSIRKTSPAAEVVWFGRNEGDLEKFMSATENDSNVRAVSIADGAADAIRNAIENCTVHTDAPLSEGAQTDEYTSGKREGIEWTNLRFRDANLSDYREGKKRILFVGDSISWGYGDQMDGKIDMTMDYVRTSRGADDIALIRELEFMFAQYRYDYIHINIGLHDRGLSASDYASEMRKLLKKIQSSEATAKILFTNTTDKAVLVGNEWLHDSKGNAVIEQMNEEIYGVCQEMNIPYNDLYSFVTENELKKIDSLHFAEAGYERMATQISAFIRANIS